MSEVMPPLKVLFRGDARHFCSPLFAADPPKWSHARLPCSSCWRFLPCTLQDKKERLRHPDLKKWCMRWYWWVSQDFGGFFWGGTLKYASCPQPFLVPQHGVWRSNTSARCGCAYERADRVELDIASMTPMVRRCRSRTPAALSPAPG